MQPTSIHTQTNPIPRGSFWRSFRHSPPVTLGIWTVIALLLGMGTARAQTPEAGSFCERVDGIETEQGGDGPKWRFLAASCSLYDLSYDDFMAIMPASSPVRVESLEDPSRPYPAGYSRSYVDHTLDEPTYESVVRPLLRELILDERMFADWGMGPSELVSCGDDGLCRQQTPSATLEWRFIEEGGEVRLTSLRAEFSWMWEEGC